jgi:hypothetical protein
MLMRQRKVLLFHICATPMAYARGRRCKDRQLANTRGRNAHFRTRSCTSAMELRASKASISMVCSDGVSLSTASVIRISEMGSSGGAAGGSPPTFTSDRERKSCQTFQASRTPNLDVFVIRAVIPSPNSSAFAISLRRSRNCARVGYGRRRRLTSDHTTRMIKLGNKRSCSQSSQYTCRRVF